MNKDLLMTKRASKQARTLSTQQLAAAMGGAPTNTAASWWFNGESRVDTLIDTSTGEIEWVK